MGRVGLQDVPGDQPFEEHPDRGEVLFDGGFGAGGPSCSTYAATCIGVTPERSRNPFSSHQAENRATALK
jgi:hypothetical protein